MVITYEDVIPSLIENTVMQLALRDGTPSTYRITPIEGYVLHDKAYDYPLFDEEGNETGEIALGYRTSTAGCAATYDFETNPREFYTVLASSVPTDQIFGAGNNHEVM